MKLSSDGLFGVHRKERGIIDVAIDHSSHRTMTQC